MNEILNALEKRFSTRGYSEVKLTEDEIITIAKAGLQAPTAINKQEIHITALDGDNSILAEIEAEKNALRNITDAKMNFYYSAPTVFLLSADNSFHWSELDAGIAVQSMALAAESLGLGSLIIGCVRDALNGEKADYFAKALQFPENYSFRIALAVGHKATLKAPHTIDLEKNFSKIQ
ncbi:MAG: nitroreductase family protein [Lachnospiraceae bacterium]|nr:nitroreductase family protein [Lachnospiraceae bacterium]